MSFLEAHPPQDLAPFVDCLWTSTVEESTREILPDGCVEAVVALQGGFVPQGASDASRMHVLGLADRPIRAAYTGRTRLVGIRLTPAGALRLFGGGLAQPEGDEVLRRLAHAVESGEPEVLVRVLRHAVHVSPSAHPRLEHALGLFHRGASDVALVAREAGVSTRQLDRWFEQHVGVAPKLLARLARFRRAFALGMQSGDWAHVAARCGYADQAHLSREFVEFCGSPPARLRAALARIPHQPSA